MRKSIYRETLLYALALILGKGISLLMIPIVTGRLSPAEYGELEILVTVADLGSIVLGLGLADTLLQAGQLRGAVLPCPVVQRHPPPAGRVDRVVEEAHKGKRRLLGALVGRQRRDPRRVRPRKSALGPVPAAADLRRNSFFWCPARSGVCLLLVQPRPTYAEGVEASLTSC